MAQDLPPFNLPLSIVAADFNKDGALDLAVAVQFVNAPPPHPGFVSVILQNPSAPGTFFHAVKYTSAVDPVALAVGDLNGDGLPDLVVASASAPNISVLLQDPSAPGTFMPTRKIRVGSSQSGVAIGDLNGDGLADIAVAVGTRSIKVLFQDPAGPPGSFLAPIGIPVKLAAWNLAIADLDGDGANDLAVAFTAVGRVGVLLEDPTNPGTFLPEHDYAVGPQPLTVKVADMNSDGVPDLIVADLGTPTLSGGGVSVLLQKPNARGSFRRSREYQAGVGPQDAAAGDLNGDGREDLAVANGGDLSTPGTVSVMRQKAPVKGKLTFGKAVYPAMGIPTSIVIADFNGDGKLDIATADGPGAAIMFQRPNKPGRFLAPKTVGQ
jgi:hypothetical protein